MRIARYVLLAVAMTLTVILLASMPGSADSAQTQSLPIVLSSTRNDTSPPLRELAAAGLPPAPAPAGEGIMPLGADPQPSDAQTLDFSIVQTAQVGNSTMPLPIHNFEGIANLDQERPWVVPPDTNGDIGWDPVTGDKYYMQWVNLSLAAWDVTDPEDVQLILGPVPGNALFAGFGGPCENTNDGDPIILFDQLANRWMGGQFANVDEGPPFYQCVAVSQTPDPSGAWHRYEFAWPSGFNDYPKFGVWPDGYYMAANQFTGANGAGVAVLERDQMLIGAPADFIYFDVSDANPGYTSLLPSDLDGDPPPAGTPNYFTNWANAAPDVMNLWEFHVDWATPANSTFGLNSFPNESIPTANVDPSPGNIPQPGGTPVSSLAPRLMFRLAYRYMAGTEILVTNHTVDADSTNHAGVHWMDMRKDGGSWSMYQEGVYAPDEHYRWMGSVAMDKVGNIAVGYSIASPTIYPSIRYAGRLADDPLGELTQREVELVSGSGFQESTSARWGDYSSINIDPSDDCTFWYTQEYYEFPSDRAWQTRVGSFVFPSCLGPTGTLVGTVTDGSNPLEGIKIETSAPTAQPAEATTDSAGEYTVYLSPGSYTVTAGAYGYGQQTVNDVVINADGTTTQDFTLPAVPMHTVSGAVTDGNGGWPLYAHITISGDPYDPPAAVGDLWTDPDTGAYSVELAEGITYEFTVEAFEAGYLPETAAIGPLTGNVTADFELFAEENLCQPPGYVQTLTYFEDFEADDGGYATTPEDQWEWGVPTFPSGITAHSGVNVWGTNLDGPVIETLVWDSNVLSAELDVPAGGGILQYWSWFGAGDSQDYREIYVNGDLIWDDGYLVAHQQYWKKEALDLSAWAGETVTVDWVLVTYGAPPGIQGWYIDDVSIAVPGTCEVAQPAITLTKTVGLNAAECAAQSAINVPSGTTVYYCYEVTNTGNVTLTSHGLVDDQLGDLLTDFPYALAPGASVNTVEAGFMFDAVITANTTNTAVWTADEAGPAAAATAEASATVSVGGTQLFLPLIVLN